MINQRKFQTLSINNLNSGLALHALILFCLLFVQVGCAKQMGQNLCAADECFGQDLWQKAIDHIVVNNFPEEQYHGRVYSDRLNNAWTTHDTNVNISEDLLIKLIVLGDPYLLSVSAHEIAHIRSDHYSRKASLSYVSTIGSQITDPFTYREKRLKAVAKMSREHEIEADMLAVQYMEKAGYHREDYLNFLKWMKSNLKDASQSDLATHPPIIERINRIEKLTSISKSRGPGLK